MPLQETIHKWTEGGGSRLLKVPLVLLGMLGLAVWYNLAAFKNLSSIEGFDASQLARNIADGRGYTTDFVRPFSMYLIQKHRADHDPQIKEHHPDLANAPLYPVILAGVFKAFPVTFPNVAADKNVGAYPPERWIAGLNQFLFFVGVLLLFRLGTRLFDERVGWLAAAVFAGTELFWRFSISGLPTMLAVVIFIAVADVLSRIVPENPPDAEPRTGRWNLPLSVLLGGLIGLAGLTRYSFGWLILPVAVYLSILPVPRRPLLVLGSVLGAVIVMGPWVARNYMISGTPFGTAGYAIYEATRVFPGFELMRTLNPDFSLISSAEFANKMLPSLRDMIENQLPRLGGNWVCGFFLVGLLVPFRNPTLNRLRLFLGLTLATLMVVQAAGSTEVTVDSPVVNGENLLIVLAPLLFLFGVGLFQMLTDQVAGRDPGLRTAIVGIFLAVVSLPLLFSLLRPVPSALAFPPYHPARIQEKASEIGERDWMMTDIPWAVAWYGARQSLWLSLRYKETRDLERPNDFAAANGAGKPLRALYLSNRMSKSVETWGLWSWIHRARREDWEATINEWEAFLVAGAYSELQVPTGFPLKDAPYGLWPELFLMDSEQTAPDAIKGE